MLFTYTYRSSDGQRHTAEIEAESRDAAFARVRAELGIKPIKVVAVEGESGALGDRALPDGRNKRYRWIWGAAILAAAILAVVVGTWWWGRAARPEAAPYQVMTPQGAVTLSVATPLPRQMIPGDRRKIEEAVAQERDPPVFHFAAEKWLARFAEPGRAVATTEGTKPTDAEFTACLREPIRIASSDFTEVVDLKRIVTGMKREMRAYIAGGGTVEGYLAELEKRQRLEISYRENAERRLNDMLNGQDARSPSATGGTPIPVGGQDARSRSGQPPLKAAYAYWLKANAQLQAMGIYPLALPDALRSYQMSLDIEE
ncbi:MAG: hypothetical protein J6V72_22075 [Kiritimatiellae bacterium]|nr:hypothetical protein [Kiritimatiellia bacterium]